MINQHIVSTQSNINSDQRKIKDFWRRLDIMSSHFIIKLCQNRISKDSKEWWGNTFNRHLDKVKCSKATAPRLTQAVADLII